MTGALIERLEKAEAGSRELDGAIERVFADPSAAQPDMVDWARGRYTTSLDAALALAERVLPGWIWDVTSTGTCWIMPPNEQDPTGEVHVAAKAATPALALCIAILTAKAARSDG